MTEQESRVVAAMLKELRRQEEEALPDGGPSLWMHSLTDEQVGIDGIVNLLDLARVAIHAAAGS
jgi:hypothetical protein